MLQHTTRVKIHDYKEEVLTLFQKLLHILPVHLTDAAYSNKEPVNSLPRNTGDYRLIISEMRCFE